MFMVAEWTARTVVKARITEITGLTRSTSAADKTIACGQITRLARSAMSMACIVRVQPTKRHTLFCFWVPVAILRNNVLLIAAFLFHFVHSHSACLLADLKGMRVSFSKLDTSLAVSQEPLSLYFPNILQWTKKFRSDKNQPF